MIITADSKTAPADLPPTYADTIATPSSPSTTVSDLKSLPPPSAAGPLVLSPTAYNDRRTTSSSRGGCSIWASGPASHLPKRDPLTPAPPSFTRAPSSPSHNFENFPLMVHYSQSNRLADGFSPLRPALTEPYTANPSSHPFTVHDIGEEDWKRFLQDIQITGSLSRKQANIVNILPMALLGGVGPLVTRAIAQNLRRSKVGPVADLIDIWNDNFFIPRGMQVVLAQGSQTLSGGLTSPPDAHLLKAQQHPLHRTESNSSTSSSGSSDSEATAVAPSSHHHVHQGNEEHPPIVHQARRGHGCGHGGCSHHNPEVRAAKWAARAAKREARREKRKERRQAHRAKKEFKKQEKCDRKECFRLIFVPVTA